MKYKPVFLSLVIICALALAGVGGTLADFSDSEEELGDVIQAGSLDLKVEYQIQQGAFVDDPYLLPFKIRRMKPDKSYHVEKDVRNVGTIDGYLYVHFKNVACTETNDKDLDGDGTIENGPGVMDDKPEPEKVAEFGGQVGQQIVAGLGERCDMEKHIAVAILYGPAGQLSGVDLKAQGFDKNGDGMVSLDEVECEQILIGDLPACGDVYTIRYGFFLRDVLDPNWTGHVEFSYWPTNCYQGDTVGMDILLELLQTDYTPPGGP